MIEKSKQEKLNEFFQAQIESLQTQINSLQKTKEEVREKRPNSNSSMSYEEHFSKFLNKLTE